MTAHIRPVLRQRREKGAVAGLRRRREPVRAERQDRRAGQSRLRRAPVVPVAALVARKVGCRAQGRELVFGDGLAEPRAARKVQRHLAHRAPSALCAAYVDQLVRRRGANLADAARQRDEGRLKRQRLQQRVVRRSAAHVERDHGCDVAARRLDDLPPLALCPALYAPRDCCHVLQPRRRRPALEQRRGVRVAVDAHPPDRRVRRRQRKQQVARAAAEVHHRGARPLERAAEAQHRVDGLHLRALARRATALAAVLEAAAAARVGRLRQRGPLDGAQRRHRARVRPPARHALPENSRPHGLKRLLVHLGVGHSRGRARLARRWRCKGRRAERAQQCPLLQLAAPRHLARLVPAPVGSPLRPLLWRARRPRAGGLGGGGGGGARHGGAAAPQGNVPPLSSLRPLRPLRPLRHAPRPRARQQGRQAHSLHDSRHMY